MIELTLLQLVPAWVFASILFVLILLFYSAGYYLRKRKISRNPDHIKTNLGTFNGVLIGLLGLILAFTFSMADERYERRKELIIEEANNIGTAILRADLYPDSTRSLLRNNFKEYVEARIAFYQAGMNLEAVTHYYLKADSISKVIWNITAEDARVHNVILRSGQMVPALNAMIDITTTRRSAGESTIPDSILYFLFFLCLYASFILGYDYPEKTDRVPVTGFALVLSITVFTIFDLDRPRSGLIKMDVPNKKIIELRGLFGVNPK